MKQDYSKTFCNPLSLPDYNYIDREWPFSAAWMPVTGRNSGAQKPIYANPPKPFRSCADPDVLYYEGKWYMYGSTDVCYVSSDLLTWEAHALLPHRFDLKDAPKGGADMNLFQKRYFKNWIAVATVCFRGLIYLLPSVSNALYASDNPLGPFEKVGEITSADGSYPYLPDPAFLADGDRLYLYFGCGVETGIQGVELNPDKPWEMLSEPLRLIEFRPETGWECTGARHENKNIGWIEGGGAIKKNGRYYLYYSANGTTYDAYNMGCYYSDESPLSGFKPQQNGPFCEKTRGICKGAGHGSIVEGPNDTLWIFYTSVAASMHLYERRIGMDKVIVNANGELEVITSDTPQWAPGITAADDLNNAAGLYPLTFQNPAWATSAALGRDPFYVTDESMATWWEPDAGDDVRQIIVDLRSTYEVCASRVLWKEIGIDKENGLPYGAVRYKIEITEDEDPETEQWQLVFDASDNETDYLNDYRTFEPRRGNKVKLTILHTPQDISIGVISFTVFGKSI